jgi:hypothetical protein
MTELKQGRWVELNGVVRFYKDGKLHRDNELPAVEYPSGIKYWMKDGKGHRLTGPAEIYPEGEEGYYINGKQLTKEEHANHPEVKKYKLQQILNRALKDPT